MGTKKMRRKAAQKRRSPQIKQQQARNEKTPESDWRTFFQFRWKGISLTLGYPFAIVLLALVVSHADWSKVGANIDIPGFLGGSITTTIAHRLGKILK